MIYFLLVLQNIHLYRRLLMTYTHGKMHSFYTIIFIIWRTILLVLVRILHEKFQVKFMLKFYCIWIYITQKIFLSCYTRIYCIYVCIYVYVCIYICIYVPVCPSWQYNSTKQIFFLFTN